MMKNLRNMLLTLTLAALGSTSLVSMKRTHEGDQQGESEPKKQKIENVESFPDNQVFTLVCMDKTLIKICKDVLDQCETLAGMIQDLTDPIVTIPLDSIAGSVMRNIRKYMIFVKVAQTNCVAPDTIVANLTSLIQHNILQNHDHQLALNHLSAAHFLGFKPYYMALCTAIANEQDLTTFQWLKDFSKIDPAIVQDIQFCINARILKSKKTRTLHSMPSLFNTCCHHLVTGLPDSNDTDWFNQLQDIQENIQKAYYLNHKAFFLNQPVAITLADFDSFGYISGNDITSHLDDILNHDADTLPCTHAIAELQHTLDTLCSYPCVFTEANKAHQALVDCLRVLTQTEMEQLFAKLTSPSTLKLAVQLVHAQRFQINLDDTLNCLDFVTNTDFWINSDMRIAPETQLFSQANLPFVLPLLEPLFGPITKLNLYCNALSSLPESLGNLVNLTTLDLSRNKLSSLPESFGNLVNLTSLELYDNALSSLPESFGNLVNLTNLELSNNHLSSLPQSFGNLARLMFLNLQSNHLNSLPESFGNLVMLGKLHLGKNQLTSLPESFGNLVQLLELDLDGNNLSSLPESFGNLVRLRALALSKNQLSSLPESFDNLVDIRTLLLQGNQFSPAVTGIIRFKFGKNPYLSSYSFCI